MKVCLKMTGAAMPTIFQVAVHTIGRAGHGSVIRAGIMAGISAAIGANTQAVAPAAMRAGVVDEKRAPPQGLP